MLLAHLTDIHVAARSDYPAPGDEAWRLRTGKHSEELLRRLLDDLAAQRPDHVVLTGDLTLTSERAQFERARSYLEGALPGLGISVIPGNHDRWSPESEGLLQRSFGDWMRSDLGGEGFPYCHLVGEVAILALDSSPYVAGVDPADVLGFVDPGQLEKMESLAADPRLRGKALVVLLHHHLRLSEEDALAEDPKDPTPLENAAEVEAALARIPVALVLHGHRHKEMRLDLELGGRTVPIRCPGSATRVDTRPERTGRYALYEVGREGLSAMRHRLLDLGSDRFVWG